MKCKWNGNVLVYSFDGLANVEFDTAKADAMGHGDTARKHGYEQKTRDSAALARKQKDGTVITVTEAMRRAAIVESVEWLTTKPDWNMRGSAAPRQDAVIVALAAKVGMTYEAFLAKVAADVEAELFE